ncbi:hypothetical protein AX16_007171 [Volvariella volvacea WC 439]|nr:hypothetical protein AX16_007171 [Volvariella volvacea WC 439]
MPPIPNVILFGAPRCGKSSIVNMISGSDAAQGSPGEFESRCYQVPIFGQTFNIWDTPGLEENQSGAISDTAAVIKLYGLLQSLEDGVNLLIFCMRAPRITGIAANNWTLFHDVCDRKVPVVVIVTGLEQQSGEPGGMNSWWFNNKKHFERSGTVPTRHACITTMRGKEIKPGIFTYGQEYNESKEKVSRLIMSAALETAWGVPKTGWPKQVLRTVYDSGSKELEGIITMSDFGEKTVRGCRMSEGEAMVLPSALERHEKGSSNTSAYEKQGVEHVKTNLPEGRTDVVSFAGALPSDVDIEGVGARQKLIGDQLYDSKLMLLFLFIPALHLVTLKLHTLLQFDTTQSPRVYPRQEPSEDPCDPSRYRSFMSLLWTCITTILLFSWRCIHPNIPDPRVEAQRPLTNRWIAGLCGILAPELVWVWAAKESNFALKVQKDVSSKFPERAYFSLMEYGDGSDMTFSVSVDINP